MFRVAMIALALGAAPAVAMDHAKCVKLLADAYDAKDKSWLTAEPLYDAGGDDEARKAAKDEAMGARLAAQDYINALADYCETLR